MNEKRKKLLLITSGFPFGDTERGFISSEFEALHGEFDISIIAIGAKEELILPLPDDVPVEKYFHRLSSRSLRGALRILKNALRPSTLSELFRALCIKRPGLTLKRFRQTVFYSAKAELAAQFIEKKLSKEPFDVIYTYWCTELTLGAARLKKAHPELCLVTRFHGHDLYTDRRPEDFQPFRPFITNCADKLVFACRKGMDYYVSRWGGAEKAELCYLGCRSAERPSPHGTDELRIVSCSNLIPLKRVDRIIEALSLLPPELSVSWDHFGDGTERQRLETLAKEKLSGIRWRFHGRVPNSTIAGHYGAISPDLFITASSTEGGAPVSVQEAFAMGIPAIGTAVGGIPDLIVNGRTGSLLSEDPSPEELCRAVLHFAGLSPDEKRELSQNAFELWKDRFDSVRNARRFTELLLGLKGAE